MSAFKVGDRVRLVRTLALFNHVLWLGEGAEGAVVYLGRGWATVRFDDGLRHGFFLHYLERVS
ncbi:MAG TPA: hypothetical protein GX406_01965 [Pseudoclavibacter sp.]|nr:hypothetical protein [Pseudoclavibacter sp.]